MITADSRTALGMWCKEVSRMKPGQCLEIDIRELQLIPGFAHKGFEWNPADRILENIVGAAYTHSYEVHPSGRTVVFRRHEETGQRHYQSPDQRGR